MAGKEPYASSYEVGPVATTSIFNGAYTPNGDTPVMVNPNGQTYVQVPVRSPRVFQSLD